MKLGFMTWACPDWTLDEILAKGKRYGYDCVEPRVEAKHKHGLELDTSPEMLERGAERLRSGGMEIPCIATSCTFVHEKPAERERNVRTLARYVEMAAIMRVRYLRVFGGAIPQGVAVQDAVKMVVDSLQEVAPKAQKSGVRILLETHDDFRFSDRAKAVIEQVRSPAVRILWDYAHPFNAGEAIEQTARNIIAYTLHIHVHEFTCVDGKWVFLPLGSGHIPHAEVVRLLHHSAFTGCLSVEWIGENKPDEVLPQHAAKLREYLLELTQRSPNR